jgi:uncharacterized protein
MDVSQQLVALGELANLDQKMKAAKDKLESVPAAAKKADQDVEALKKKLDDADKKKATAEQLRRNLDGEMVAERAKMKKWEARADQIRGEREAAALYSEINAQKRSLRDIEDKILEAMQTLEDADKDVKALAPKHDAAAKDAAVEWKKVEAELKTLRGEVDQLGVQRDGVLARLPANIVKRYQQVAVKRQGVGVSILRGETCTSCKRTIPPQTALMIMKGAVVEECPSCNRFLVHEAMTRAPGVDESTGGASP